MSWLCADRPYPGLRPFDYEDREFFFGRQQQCGALYLMLDHSRFLAVLGNSGSGKSSLVRAGLLPLLDAEHTEAEQSGGTGRYWRWARMHPGDAPLEHLGDAIASFSDDQGNDVPDSQIINSVRHDRILFALRKSSLGVAEGLDNLELSRDCTFLIIVDQFEELFRFGTNAADDHRWRDQATQFVQLLLEASRDPEHRVHILITMRSDFVGDCSQYYGLPEAVSASQYLVPSLTRDQREEAIRGPVNKVGSGIEPHLLERLLNDSSSESDQLPILQHCLSRLWVAARQKQRQKSQITLTMSHYESAGGMKSALSRHAEEVMRSLQGLEDVVELTFRTLSEVDEEGRAIRRALRFDRLLAETGVAETDLRKVLDRFRADDCSFLVPSRPEVPQLTSDSRIDVGHESLLRRWQRMSAKETVAAGKSGGTTSGWLQAEARDGATYRALLSLVENTPAGHPAILPLEQVKPRLEWWQSRPRTAAWADRYGGKIADVKALFTDSVAALRRRAMIRGAIAAACVGVLLVVSAVFTWSYRQFVVAENRAATERAMLLNEMTSMASNVSTNLRFTPWTGDAIHQMLTNAGDFSTTYSRWLISAREKDQIGMAVRLSATTEMLSSDLDVNAGHIDRGISELTRALNALEKLSRNWHKESQGHGGWFRRVAATLIPQPKSTPTVWLPVLESDILVRRSLVRRLDGNFSGAAADLSAADERLRGVLATLGPAIALPCDRSAAAETAEKVSERLARLYSSRIDFELYDRPDVAAAEHDLQSLRNIVTSRAKIASEIPAGGGSESAVCLHRARRFWNEQAYNIVTTRSADVETAEGDYDKALPAYTEVIKSLDARRNADSGNIMAALGSAFYHYRLARALMLRGEKSDLKDALGNLRVAAEYFGRLKRTDNNDWWSIVDGRVERALGDAASQAHQMDLAKSAFSTAMVDDHTLLRGDPDNRRFLMHLQRDSRDFRRVAADRLPVEVRSGSKYSDLVR